mmetsp:Transcript_7246/g.10710  ORF Transcript_7246/g.10710 Transcript_7246/m.10710 type:complete len:388 (+) Transcript_7246:7-1170(+)
MNLKVFETCGTKIVGFLEEEEVNKLSLVCKTTKGVIDTMKLWSTLFASVKGAMQDYMAPKPSPSIRVRTPRPPPKLLRKPQNSTELKTTNKQWFCIPESFLSKLKLVTINKAAQLRKDKQFASSAQEIFDSWKTIIQRMLKTLEEKSEGNFQDTLRYWKDKSRILGQMISELNDQNVAKMDKIFEGLKFQKELFNELENLGNSYARAKSIFQLLLPLEKPLGSLDNLTPIEFKYQDAEIVELFYKIVSYVKETLKNQFRFNSFFTDKNSLKFLQDTLKVANYLLSHTTSTQVGQELNYIKQVSSDLVFMVEEFSSKLSTHDSQFIKLYSKVPLEFDIWDSENKELWAQVVENFKNKLTHSEEFTEPKVESFSEDEEETVIVPNWNVT